MDVTVENHRFVEEQLWMLRLRNRLVERKVDSVLMASGHVGLLIAQIFISRYVGKNGGIQ